MGLLSTIGAGLGLASTLMGNQNRESTSTTEPWGPQQPYLKNIFQQAQNQYTSGGPQYYPGLSVAPFNMDQLQAQQYARDYARTSQPLIDQYQNALTFAQGKVLDVANNPYVTAMADAVTNPIQKRLMEDILPSVRGSATLAGNQHSSRRGIMEGKAIGDTARAMADARANVFGSAYGQGLGTFNTAFGAGPTALSMGQFPGQAMGNVGSQIQAMDQARIDEARRRWDFMQGQPEANLRNYADIVRGNYGSASTVTPPPVSPLSGALGGYLTGYGLQQQGFNPFGTQYVGPNMRSGYTDIMGYGVG